MFLVHGSYLTYIQGVPIGHGSYLTYIQGVHDSYLTYLHGVSSSWFIFNKYVYTGCSIVYDSYHFNRMFIL